MSVYVYLTEKKEESYMVLANCSLKILIMNYLSEFLQDHLKATCTSSFLKEAGKQAPIVCFPVL